MSNSPKEYELKKEASIPIGGAECIVDIKSITSLSENVEEIIETNVDDLSPDKNTESLSFLPIDSKIYYASRAYMRHEGPAATHINSYNYAMCYLIPHIIDTKGIVSVEHEGQIHKVSVSSAFFGKPKHKENDESVILLNPKLCLDRKISYFSPLYVNITYFNPSGAVVVKKKKLIGEVPVMILSTLCNLTPIKNDEHALAGLHEDVREVGGYFIVKGQQKVVIHQIVASHNQICTYKGKNNNKGGPKFAIYAETRSGSSSSHSTTARAGILEKSKLLSCTIQYIEQPVPIGIVFRALGVQTESEMAHYILPAEWYVNPPSLVHKTMISIIVRSLEQSYEYKTQDEALHYIGKNGQKYSSSKEETLEDEDAKSLKTASSGAAISYARHLLSNEFLPHIGLGESFNNNKCFFLGYMILNALLTHAKLIPVTDRDHFMNKRLQTSGMIIATQFFNAFRQLMKHIEESMRRNLAHNIPIVASSYITMPHMITSSLTSALTSNKWNSKGQNQGISQTIDAFNYCALLSCLRKFIIPLNADAGKIEKPRHLHGSQWGVACVTGDTLITLADNTQIPIKDLCGDEKIMTVNPVTLKKETSEYYNFFKLENKEILEIQDNEGKIIKCTSDHPFLVRYDNKNIFVKAENLVNGDVLISSENSDKVNILSRPGIYFTFVAKITKLLDKKDVYDLTTISENHTLILNGFVTSNCMYKTPEGKQVGLVLGFAMGAYVSVGTDPEPIIEILKEMDIVPMNEIASISDFLRYTKIFVNGNPQGYTHYPEEVTNHLRRLRQSASIDMEVSILYDRINNSIYISTEAGRFGRAVALAPNGELKLTESVLDEIKAGKWDTHESNAWIKLMEKGYTELLFKDEEEEMNVAIFPSDFNKMNPYLRIKYTHCELTPDMIEGAGVSTSPHNDHNQAPRNIYQESMSHQAIGNTSNIKFHRKGKWFALKYPQKPLVSTRISKELGFDDMPMGQNVMFCVMPWFGRGQEDSVLLHKQAVDRDLFSTICYLAYECTLSHPQTSNSSRYESFEIPEPTKCNDFNGNASKLKLHDDGGVYIPVGTLVNKDDILIGVVVTGVVDNPMFNKQKNKINISQKYDHKLPGVVHSVQMGYDGKGFKYIRLVVAQERKPVLGDKFCYTPDHEVLTTEGWVKIADVTTKHLVASLKDGKELVYEHPTEVVSFPLEKGEKLIHVSTNQVDLCVTANHNMYVKTRSGKEFVKKEAKDLFDVHVHYKKDADWTFDKNYGIFELPEYTRNNREYKHFPFKDLPMDPWLTFYGIWLAEGGAGDDHRVQFAANKPRIMNKLKEILPLLGFEYTIPKAKGTVISIYDQQLASYMRPLSVGAINKSMEDWVWDLNKEQSRILLEGMLLGDGHTHGNTPMYDTSSVKLKDDVMRLVLHCGWVANAKMRYAEGREKIIKGKNTITRADAWRITIIKTQLTPAVNKHIKNQQVWEDTEHSHVFCCTMPNGLLYVRNSIGDLQRPVWSGNSANHGQKGTVGSILDTNEMPFLKKRGWTPDLIINPLAFPSRMTIGMLLEMIMGVALTSTALQTDDFDKPICLDDPEQVECMTSMLKEWKYPETFNPETDYENLDGDGTPWNKSFSMSNFFDALKRLGINQYSEEIVVNPMTGTELVYPIFAGVVFYQRLKHMPVDKIHARARGPRHGLHKQPTEGRKKGGGFRVGHMERDFLIPASPVALREGISVMIKDLAKFEKVWGYNFKKEGLVTSQQINFGTGENRPHYVMTLQDGRTIEGSNNHPFYTEAGEYSDMKYLKVGEDKLACTINPPLVDIENEIKLCDWWGWFQFDFFKLLRDDDIDEHETFRRSLCLARLMGLAASDGYADEIKDIVRVFPDHKFDVETIQQDVFRLTGEMVYPKTEVKIKYSITLPEKLSRVIKRSGIITGNRVNKECRFPPSINIETPLPILREFLGGLFGGDGHTICIAHRRDKYYMKSICFSWSRSENHLGSLRKTFELLQALLGRFGIKSDIQTEKLTTFAKRNNNNSTAHELVLNIPSEYTVQFEENIGFRYCENKSLKLAIGASYRRFRDNVLRQRDWLCERTDELSGYRNKKENGGTKIDISKHLKQAIKELESRELVLDKNSIPTPKMVGRILLSKNNNEIRSETFPTVDKYFEECGVLDMFLNEDDNKITYAVPHDKDFIPVYYLKVIDIREKYKGATSSMCDITVEQGIESYVANGVVSHNCMLGQGAPHMVNDRLFHQSDAHQMHVCSICGIQASSVSGGNLIECRICGSNECVLVDIPYGTKLMGDEFQVMNFVPRIITLPSNTNV